MIYTPRDVLVKPQISFLFLGFKKILQKFQSQEIYTTVIKIRITLSVKNSFHIFLFGKLMKFSFNKPIYYSLKNV